jgi:hypothetical protein
MKRVITWAQLNGWLVFHAEDRQPDAERGDYRQHETGFPDLVLVKDGQLIFAELKSRTGKIQKPQQPWIDALKQVAFDTTIFQMGRITQQPIRMEIWRPADWPEIEKLLARGPA